MGGQEKRPGLDAKLRLQAEQIFRYKATQSALPPDDLSPEQTQLVLHELRVHQIELELQNEELRRSQLELDAERARYFDLYDLAPVGYCTVGTPGLILKANLAAAQLLGAARGALIKQPITRFIHKDDQDIFYLNRKQIFESGKQKAFELRIVKHDGTPFWANLTASTALDACGVPELRVVLIDITDRKQTEAVALARERELEAARAYVLNAAGNGKLIAALRAVVAGYADMSPAVAAAMARSADAQVGDAPTTMVLGAREREVLCLVADGLRSAQIAARLGISAHTVDVHRRNIRRKLGLRSTAELTRYALRKGLRAF